MRQFKVFLKDLIFSKGATMSTANENDWINLFDIPFLTQLNEFLANSNNNSAPGLQSFVENHTRQCNTSERFLLNVKNTNILAVGVGLLDLFLQKNWTGPDFEKISQLRSFDNKENIQKELVIDGEDVIPIVELQEVLFLSKIILETCYKAFPNLLAAKIWFLRCVFINQQILEELSPKLFDKISLLIEEIKNEFRNLTNSDAILCYLEFARIFMYYENVQKSKIELQSACEIAGIDLTLSGALGKRTKFQHRDLAQLVLQVSLEEGKNIELASVNEVYSSQPRDVKLDDDVRLDRIKFADTSHQEYPPLNGLQQGILLGSLFQTQKSQPRDGLVNEELEPLINCILSQRGIWSFRMSSLFLRSKLEAAHKRTVERAMMQVQILSDCLTDSETSQEEKFSLFFISYFPPKWEIRSTLANMLASMGSIRSALEIYKGLEDWENIIYCYNALQLRHKAKEIIEQELKKNPTPKLWCLLGDATDEVSCYENAWKLSKEKSARAQRHWAYFYYFRKQYAECIEHFQKSLEINSLQKELWYRLGYAALMEEKWEISANAYRRYCVLDPECFEAWNNLGRCYCELKQKYRAWRALQEALKVDYSKWRVWDNYMLVSSDLQAFEEVIKSYHEILNLKEKHLDIPVLNALVVGYKKLEEEEEGKSTGKTDKAKFRNRLLELFGRLTSQIINNEELWFLYSEVVEPDTPEHLIKKHQLLTKAHRSAMNKANWDSKLENCNQVVYVLSKMVEVGLKIGKADALMSCKLAAEGAIAKVKRAYPDAGICEELEKNLEEVNAKLDS